MSFKDLEIRKFLLIPSPTGRCYEERRVISPGSRLGPHPRSFSTSLNMSLVSSPSFGRKCLIMYLINPTSPLKQIPWHIKFGPLPPNIFRDFRSETTPSINVLHPKRCGLHRYEIIYSGIPYFIWKQWLLVTKNLDLKPPIVNLRKGVYFKIGIFEV